MGCDDKWNPEGVNQPEEEWVQPFRRALGLHGRSAEKHKWYILWARKLSRQARGRVLREVTRKDVEEFLATLSTSPGIAPWQTDQAADSLRILIGSVLGQDWARSIRAPASPPPPDIPVPRGDDPVERLRYAIRCRNYSGRTEKSYVFWVDRFLSFCRCGGLGEDAHFVRAFLERLVIGDGVSSATQAQALNGLVFHFRHVVCEPLGDLGDFQRSKRPRKLPVVLGREEVRRLLESIDPTYRLPAALMYGAGLRLLETLCLRGKDVDLERRQIAVRDGKGRRTG